MTSAPLDWVELAHRGGDGLDVTLRWSRSTNRIQVSVVDDRNRGRFELDVDPAEALAAFHHPFAFATAQGRRFADRRRRPLSLSTAD